jgi:hypothetical protein
VFVGQDFPTKRASLLFGLQNGMTDGQGPLVTICVVRHDHSPSHSSAISSFSQVPLLDQTASIALTFPICVHLHLINDLPINFFPPEKIIDAQLRTLTAVEPMANESHCFSPTVVSALLLFYTLMR